MNGVRPLDLILAVVTGCVALAGMWLHLAGGQASLPAEVVEGATSQQSCVDDLSVQNLSVWDRGNGFVFQNPPDYADGDDIAIFYDVVNSSCREVTVTVVLTGSVSGATIHDADGSQAPCLDGCTIAAGATQNSSAQWDLGKHPNATGEKVVATVTIDAPSDFSDTDTSNDSATSAQSINIVNEETEPEPAPDVAVKSATASPSEAVVGDTIEFTVAVQNEGDADAESDTTVTLHLGDDTAALDSDTVTTLAAEAEGSVTLSWDTDDAEAGEHSLRVVAATDGDGNAENDSMAATVTLVEPSVDVAVKSVTASATEAVVGDTVDFTVTLENRGNVVAATPAVSLFDANGAEDAAPLASVTANTIAVGDETTVSISWDTGDASAGEYSLRAVATVSDDDDSTNDSATTTLTLHNQVEVSLSLSDDNAATAISGNSVPIGFTLANAGDHATGQVTVSLYVTVDDEERGEQEPAATTTIPTIAVGGSAKGSFDWDTADVAVGDYELAVVIHTIGDTDKTNNEASQSIEIRNWLIIKNVSPTSAEAVTGGTVNFTAQVENVGQDEVTGVTVGLYESRGNEALASATIDSVAAGDTEDASIQWDTTGRDAGQVELVVVTGADAQASDRDDSQSVNVTIRNPIELSSATPASEDNIAGTAVSINVEVRNESGAEVTDVEVRLDVVEDCENEEDEEEEQKIGCATIAAIPAGETGAAVLEWDTDGVNAGEYDLKVIAGMDDFSGDDNDELSFTITLRDPVIAVELSSATINRSVSAIGQTLDVTAKITNHGEVPAAVPVNLYLVGSLQHTTAAATATTPSIEPGSTSEVTLQWDSTGEVVGAHTLKIAAELPGDTTADDNEALLEIQLLRSAFDGAHDVDNCVEDVRIQVTDIRDLSDETRSPPDYQVGETLRATYRIYNFSCQTDITLALTMTGPNDQPISDASAVCFSDCFLPFGSRIEGETAWTIPALPALNAQPFEAAVTIVSPSDFVDVDEANNSTESTDQINIVHPDNIVLHLGEQTGDKVSTVRLLAGPDFGEVDVRLVSVNALQTTLPFAAETAEIVVAAANDGPTTEPVTLRFVLVPDDDTDSRVLHQRPMVIPNGQTRTETVAMPLRDVLPGVHTVEVRLAAAVDQSLENNAATVEITRMAPLVNVTMKDVVFSPDVLILGDEATVSLTVQNNSEIALPLSLELYADDDSEPIGTQTIDELAPDGQSEEQIAWRVPASARKLGQHTLTLMASSDDFGAVATVKSEVIFHIDAEILGINASPEGTAMQGEKVAIEVEVRNNGPATVNVPVTLRFPSATKQPETLRPSVPAESTETARFTWRTRDYAVGDHMLTATVPEQHNVAGRGTSMELPFRVSSLVVTATIVDVSAYPTAPMVGEPVTITVKARNDGPVATRIPITLHFPQGGRQPKTRSPHVLPGQTETETFEWLTGNSRSGTHQFRIEVAAVGNPVEYLDVELSAPVVNATIVDVAVNPEIPRLGEPVTISVTVRNDGWIPTNIPVTLHFPSDEKQPETQRSRVEPGAVDSVAFTWRTSRYEPGIHDFRVEVASDPPASQRFEVELLPPIVDVAIVGISSDPADTAVQGQHVKIWVDVINNGPSALNVPVQLAFPSDEKQPERRLPRIEPGEIARVEFTWKTANYDVGTHLLAATLMADYNVTELDASATIQIALVPAQLMASIIDISWSPEFPSVGEPVRITVTVRNDGIVAANIPVTLHFPPGGRQPETRSPRVESGHTGTATFDWLTGNFAVGTHQFRVEVAAVDTPYQRFTIDLLPAVENVAIVGMGTYPAETAMVGEPVEVWVDVRNDGPVAIRIPVQLAFPSASKRPEVQSPRVGPGETARVWFEWKTSNYKPGIHTLKAAIPLDDNVTVGDRSAELRFHLTPLIINATIVNIAVSPEAPRVGEPATITVTVRNDGRIAANIPVTLHFPPGGRQPETRSHRIDPGATGEVSFTWRTSRYEPGIHAFVVEVASTPPSARPFTIELLPALVNVSIVGMGSDPAESAIRGQHVKIWVDVINNGPSALNVPVQLSFPSSDKQPERKSPWIEPGQTARVEFTWKTSNYGAGEHHLTATLMAEHNITELAKSATIQIRLVSPRLAASIVDISWHPPSPVVGEPVSITLTVRNNGSVAANIPVKLYFPSVHRQPETRRPRVAPGAVGTASFTWRTSRYEPGDHVFRVQIPGVAGAFRTFEIELRPPEVDFAVVSFQTPDPMRPIVKGDWVEMTVVVQNQGPYSGRGTVYLLNGANPDAMYEQAASLEPGEFREVEFTWKTLRYPVGGYELLARVDAEHDTDPGNDRSDLAPVHLLTDRDITVGFGSAVRPAVFAESTSEVGLSLMPRYRNDISVVGNSHTPVDRPIAAASDLSMGVSPKPAGRNYDPVRMYWRWRSAQKSPWECARLQQTVGESLPRAALCPKAPALVR